MDEWSDAEDSLPSGRFGSGSQAAGAAKAAGGAADADESSAVRFLDEEADGALFMNQAATWSDAAGAPAPDSSLQAQLPDWGAVSAVSGGNGSAGGSNGYGSGGFGATDSPAQQGFTAGDGLSAGGFDAGGPAAAPLQQDAGPTAEQLAQQLQAIAKAEPFDFSDPMALLTEDLEASDLQARLPLGLLVLLL